jgi:hypothetical protein
MRCEGSRRTALVRGRVKILTTIEAARLRAEPQYLFLAGTSASTAPLRWQPVLGAGAMAEIGWKATIS